MRTTPTTIHLLQYRINELQQICMELTALLAKDREVSKLLKDFLERADIRPKPARGTRNVTGGSVGLPGEPTQAGQAHHGG